MDKKNKTVIDELSQLMEKHDLSKIKFSDGKYGYELKKNSSEKKKTTKETSRNIDPVKKNEKIYSENSLKSPLVGTAYLSPEPGAKNFVEIGQNVKIGQVLLIIEAMKTMNEITADKDGKIKKIFIKNETPVEFGEPLVLIE